MRAPIAAAARFELRGIFYVATENEKEGLDYHNVWWGSEGCWRCVEEDLERRD